MVKGDDDMLRWEMFYGRVSVSKCVTHHQNTVKMATTTRFLLKERHVDIDTMTNVYLSIRII